MYMKTKKHLLLIVTLILCIAIGLGIWKYVKKQPTNQAVYEVVEVTRLFARCDAIGPGCESDPLLLKDSSEQTQRYKLYGDVVDETGRELTLNKDVQTGQKVHIKQETIDGNSYITKMTVINN